MYLAQNNNTIKQGEAKMALLDYNLDEAKPLKTIPDGEEVRVRIVKAEQKDSKKGTPQIEVVLVPSEHADAEYIYYYMGLIHDGLDDRQRNNVLLRLKEFREVFDLPWPSDPKEDWSGQEAYAIVREEEGQDGKVRNSIKKFVGKA